MTRSVDLVHDHDRKPNCGRLVLAMLLLGVMGIVAAPASQAGNGYTLYGDESRRDLPAYTVKFTNSNLEVLRDDFQFAVNQIHANTATRLSIAPGIHPVGEPARGEIIVHGSLAGAPCSGGDGCGGPRTLSREGGYTYITGSRIWLNVTGITEEKSEDFDRSMVAHELGHALGLDHHDDGVALMDYRVGSADKGTYKAGDLRGLQYLAGNTAPPSGSAKQVREASSLAGWNALGVGGAAGPVTASKTASIVTGGTKIIYSVSGGRVFEAASNAGWNNLWTGIEGVSNNAVAALTLNGVKYVYTIKNGVVYEAHSASGWRNVSTGIVGVGNDALAVTVLNGVKYIFTISNGNVFEAHSANGWRNQATGINGVSNQALAVITLGGVKYVYTVVGGMVHEAHSANGWRNIGTGITGVSSSALAAIPTSGAKVVYTVVGGTVWEAGSAAGWRNLSTGVPGTQVSAIPIGSGGKVIYTN